MQDDMILIDSSIFKKKCNNFKKKDEVKKNSYSNYQEMSCQFKSQIRYQRYA